MTNYIEINEINELVGKYSLRSLFEAKLENGMTVKFLVGYGWNLETIKEVLAKEEFSVRRFPTSNSEYRNLSGWNTGYFIIH